MRRLYTGEMKMANFLDGKITCGNGHAEVSGKTRGEDDGLFFFLSVQNHIVLG